MERVRGEEGEDRRSRRTGESPAKVMLTTHLFNLCEKKNHRRPTGRALTHVRERGPAATSPVSGSLITLTDAGPSGQAQTSGPSRSCQDMMDRCSSGCQAATLVHCPVGVHQKTLGKHPVDLICIQTRRVEGSIAVGSASLSSPSARERMSNYVYRRLSGRSWSGTSGAADAGGSVIATRVSLFQEGAGSGSGALCSSATSRRPSSGGVHVHVCLWTVGGDPAELSACCRRQ